MGSSDSTCCGAKASASYTKTDTDILELQRNRKSQNIQQRKSPQPGTIATIKSEGEYTPIPTDKVITALTIYQQHALDLNKNYQREYDTLMQTFLEDITEINNNHHNNHHSNHRKHRSVALQLESTPNTKKYTSPRPRSKKRKYNSVSTQIAILNSEGARAQSLLLCIKTVEIEEKDEILYFGFLSFLRQHLDDLAVEELFNKFPKSQSLSSSQFVSLLTLTVIIYKIKLYQLVSGTYDQPEIEADKIKASIEHVAVWCVRRFGRKKHKIESVHVMDDLGNEIQGKDHLYKLYFTKNNYKQNLCDWVQEYVDNDGIFH